MAAAAPRHIHNVSVSMMALQIDSEEANESLNGWEMQ